MKKSDKLKEELNPFQKKLTCKNANPIICAIDVTGSMGDWSKIIWDKLPMFYGQIMIQNYLSDPSISFAAIGDSRCDEAPLQITEFAQGSAIDDWISKLWLEGGGGAQHYETYELAAYYYAKHCSIPNAHYSKIKPFFFLTGDEGFYPAVRIDDIAHMFGDHIRAGITSEEIFTELKSKFNVFLLHKPYSIEKKELRILAQWQHVLGSSHVIILQEPKAVVDLMLGIIAIVSKSRTLETYIKDMQERGQTAHRIYLVRKALSELAEEVATNQLTLSSHSKSDELEKDEELQKIKNYFLEFPQKVFIINFFLKKTL